MSHSIVGESLDMDAASTSSTMAGAWDMNSGRPSCAPQFTSLFDMKPSVMDSTRSHLNVGLVPSPTLNPSLGDYLANHSHRLMIGTSFGQPPMISLRTGHPSHFMKEFAPRNEEFVSPFYQKQPTRGGDEDLAGAESSPNMSLSTPAVADTKLHGDTNTSYACLPQLASRSLPMLPAADKTVVVINETDVKSDEEEKRFEDVDNENEDDDEEDNDGDDDNDDDASAWPCRTPTSSSVSASLPGKAVVVVRYGGCAGSSSPIACQDCGKQAKKDCVHMRCRTCCKSGGLECSTHVKSTWVPAYKRRQKQQLLSSDMLQPVKLLRSRAARTACRPKVEQGTTSNVARAAISHTSNSTETPTPSSELNWLQQEGKLKRMLPAETRENAVFKCVKMTGFDDGREEFAYQTVVRIGGHIYKGMLYDHGVDTGQVSSSSIAELCLGGGRSTALSTSVTIDLAANIHGSSESLFPGGGNNTML